MDAEQVGGVGPDGGGSVTRPLGPRLESVHGVFVGVLGLDGLARAEIIALAIYANGLVRQAFDVDFDPAGLGVPARAMGEAAEIEIGARARGWRGSAR